MSKEARLVVVSNRVGPLSDEGKAGGLAVGLADALRRRGGLWFGWSGETSEAGTDSQAKTETEGEVKLVTIDMTEDQVAGFYLGYANRSLWPLLHYRLDLARFERETDRTYRAVNREFARRLMEFVSEDDLVWVHDYHFFYLGEELRRLGFKGRLGFFLHIPFSPPEMLAALPGANDLVGAMLAYDLVGFQTMTDRRNFANYCKHELHGQKQPNDRVRVGDRVIEAKVFPIGIDAESFAEFAASEEAEEHAAMLRSNVGRSLPIVGVDRLDYSKGIIERLLGFERLLENYPERVGTVQFLQVAPLSRSEVEEYVDLRGEFEGLVGRINGRFAALDWTPVHIMTTGLTRRALAGIYRAARVCMVTPLRDGMNLVAKEFVAAQDEADPGVLILSRFAGARSELGEALIVNPFATDEMAAALERALTMPLEERQRRWRAMRDKVFANTAAEWCRKFIEALEDAGREDGDRPADALENR
ncbi:alpha,alpha-trehalose-phosphate synthase (UDP-forming) [Aureimonas endophytica]|uniref:Alpha,alpha-trehalose-phosphate synthase (UDP-forming) n=1 Tax=Aureimonas endophytica TaxID=2027858 RepID=A0A917A3L2_9HYPH|nr:trehalose-6-phosphate synthase [Aureimonas endophytica]GGE25137.1 alpha,alpha-trehalose-phosphate synthase (UDP-forming) [Aureimonas endophytica]